MTKKQILRWLQKRNKERDQGRVGRSAKEIAEQLRALQKLAEASRKRTPPSKKGDNK